MKDKDDNNCLFYATTYGFKDIVKLLSKRNIEYSKSNDGTTCLHVAARKGFLSIVKYLLSGSKKVDEGAF
jgi:ankyrin repeat protein